MRPIRTLGRFGLFVGQFIKSSWGKRPPPGKSLEEAYRIGIKSLPILVIISAFIGTNLAIQGYAAFQPLGGQRLVGMFVALAGVRELAPVIAAAMIAAKAGTEMASQIAVMRIRAQIDALEVMAVDPVWYLVTPRFLGILLVLPALTILSIFSTLVAAYCVAVFQLGLNSFEFIEYVRTSITGMDFVYCMIKGWVFGLVICSVSCYCGFNAKSGPEGVGQATNAAVVTVAVSCVMLNYLMSEIFYG